MNPYPILLGVNIDHVATLRQARKTRYPEPLLAAMEAEMAGADSITVHLREDRRHIQERDVLMLNEVLQTRMNLEMAVTKEMLAFAKKIKPHACCLVPEKREELTTEGGLDVVKQEARIKEACDSLGQAGIQVSLFIDPCRQQIEAALRCHAPWIEIHTGEYADASLHQQSHFLKIIKEAVCFAHEAGLQVNAGHGLHYHNVEAIAAIPEIIELNIGHGIVGRALFVGIKQAVIEMKQLMLQARRKML
ncbi:MAG: Pyridoxine 5'-phosphate synthase [uncultured bacterium]|nr:MAG: Pyridoxine 5'-phosphate synthase [uncultured bacterium]OGT15402.1 MAG: pyridoxine 5'-phosphate synthase [Gammaproteobacteria bacterium RIFCSPHIGHO2_02_FULL_38_33]OGT23596.1 MAG: pyridoxine 5'-phosphate synthase [Gammaproteobacteria bacterium RIFCSPHIGHO2_12_38_15]OGT68143.1 MAG: pyridoxine 5'-phosphate synthase [Gammaproteobacteria bacterium RIFCSPLOWO2_02_FULL_38_11]OGT77835.1 MAG: pyridoxine 5'-phosphate synthase [Gammaproteobacteria bacterium RIFCSPLOWO2_12_FULL_38_14]